MSEAVGQGQALEALRSAGAQGLDPVRFHQLEVLARRLEAQPEPVRRRLEARLTQGLAALGERLRQAQQAAGEEAAGEEAAALSGKHPQWARELRRLLAAGDCAGVRRLALQSQAGAARATPGPLAQLNRYIATATQDKVDDGLSRAGQGGGREISSARRFRETWSKIDAERQVDQAVVRAPENAGPLNSHTLVLRSLALMRDISPDYLRRFLSHVDSLLWLEQAEPRAAGGDGKALRKAKPKK